MYPILKPGAVVKIKKLQSPSESRTGCYVTKKMVELSGSTAKITEIRVHSDNPLAIRYFINLDNHEHCWAIDFFGTVLLKRKSL